MKLNRSLAIFALGTSLFGLATAESATRCEGVFSADPEFYARSRIPEAADFMPSPDQHLAYIARAMVVERLRKAVPPGHHKVLVNGSPEIMGVFYEPSAQYPGLFDIIISFARVHLVGSRSTSLVVSDRHDLVPLSGGNIGGVDASISFNGDKIRIANSIYNGNPDTIHGLQRRDVAMTVELNYDGSLRSMTADESVTVISPYKDSRDGSQVLVINRAFQFLGKVGANQAPKRELQRAP